MTTIPYTEDFPITRTEPFGVDFSMHNGAVDMAKVRAHTPKITFAWGKTGESYGYEDPKFDEFRTKFEDDGIWFGGYHFFYPAEDPKAQVKKFLEIGGRSLAGYAWDMEFSHGQAPAKILSGLGIAVMEMLNMGLPVWVYGPPYFLNDHVIPEPLAVPEWFGHVNWWIAQVLTSGREHPGPVEEVRGVSPERVIIHQSAWKWKGSLIGQVGSYHLDGNRWLKGTPGNVTAPETPEPEPETPPEIDPGQKTFRVTAPRGLNVRDVPIGQPGSQVIGLLPYGASVTALEVVTIGEDVWARIGDWKCAAVKYNGKTYLE